MTSNPTRVLFVCLGNICRSPSAEGVFTALVDHAGVSGRIEIDSAGTADYHIGKSPDPRAIAAAARRDVDLSNLRGRQVAADGFYEFDYIIGMDHSNIEDLEAVAPSDTSARIYRFLEFAEDTNEQEVPDPYYGGDAGFEPVLDMIEDASRGLLKEILEK